MRHRGKGGSPPDNDAPSRSTCLNKATNKQTNTLTEKIITIKSLILDKS
jgi:hypothetical protein